MRCTLWTLLFASWFLSSEVAVYAADAKPAEKPVAKTAAPAKPTAAAKSTTEKKPTTARKPTRINPAEDGPAALGTTAAKPKAPPALTPGGKYVAGDMQRPRPVVIAPPTESTPARPGRPPSDAIVLFDGTDLSQWVRAGRPTEATTAAELKPTWEIKGDYMQCLPRTGSIATKQSFGDCQLHVEWATPAIVSGAGQGRGNSGILLHGLGEVQVLDSYGNDTYPDGQAAAIYHAYPPRVNASRKPGEWQSYDIIIELARIDSKTKEVTRPARITVLHNGIVVHHAAELPSRSSEFRFALQDHGNTVRYRNIWLRPLKAYDAR